MSRMNKNKMKKILYTIIIVLTLFSCENNKTTLSGKVLNYGDKTNIYLYEVDYSNPCNGTPYVSKISKDGDYKFELKFSENKYYLLTIDTSEWISFKENELNNLFSSNFISDNCNKIYYSNNAFLYLKSDSGIKLDIDFKKIEDSCSRGVNLKFGESNVFEKTFYKEFYEMNGNSLLYEKLSDTIYNARPRYMEIVEANKLFIDYLKEIDERVEYIKSIDVDLYNLIRSLLVNDSKDLMQQYYHFMHRERVLDFYMKGKEFPEYENMFDYVNMEETGSCRENFQHITSYIVFLRNQELNKFEKFYPWSEDMELLVERYFNNELGVKYINAWNSLNNDNQ